MFRSSSHSHSSLRVRAGRVRGRVYIFFLTFLAIRVVLTREPPPLLHARDFGGGAACRPLDDDTVFFFWQSASAAVSPIKGLHSAFIAPS